MDKVNSSKPFIIALARFISLVRSDRAGDKLEKAVQSLPKFPITFEEVEERFSKWKVRANGVGNDGFEVFSCAIVGHSRRLAPSTVASMYTCLLSGAIGEVAAVRFAPIFTGFAGSVSKARGFTGATGLHAGPAKSGAR